MDGLFFLFSIIGIGMVMRWLVQNDRVAPDKPTTGWFAMTELPWRRKRHLAAWRRPVETPVATQPAKPGATKPGAKQPGPAGQAPRAR